MDNTIDDKFISFCKAGNLIGIINHINMNKINIHVNFNENIDEGFIMTCENGQKNIVEYLINLHKINIHNNNEEGFRWAWKYGHTHIVKYPIYTKINIHANNEAGVRFASNYKYKHIQKYLLSCGCHSNDRLVYL
jgi:hypothetical protein